MSDFFSSGWSTFVSTHTQNTPTSSPPSESASTLGDPQPQTLALLKP